MFYNTKSLKYVFDFQRQTVKRFSKANVKRFSNKGKAQKQHQHKHKSEKRQDVKISYEFHRVMQDVLDSLVAFVPYMVLIVKSKIAMLYMVT